MNYDAMFQRAFEIANQQYQLGQYYDQDDTICVLCTRSGMLYTGVNKKENVNGMIMNIHAEADAIRAMQSNGESAIAGVLLISSLNRTPLLPCEHCMRWILSLHPDNVCCEILMHDRAVPISEFSVSAASGLQPAAPFPDRSPASVTLSESASNDSSLIMGRINDLLGDEEEKTTEQPKEKKRFGGLFRRKS